APSSTTRAARQQAPAPTFTLAPMTAPRKVPRPRASSLTGRGRPGQRRLPFLGAASRGKTERSSRDAPRVLLQEEPVMRSVMSPNDIQTNDYPTTDGRPMAETELHRDLMLTLIETLKAFYAQDDRVCVSGNLLLFYERGNKRRHVSPDVFVAKGVGRRLRDNYLTWQEGKGPDFVIELTSSSTRHEDTARKYRLYQGTLKVREHFLFDPRGDSRDRSLQGYRLFRGVYRAVRPLRGRLPSQVVGLHLERHGQELRLWDPATGRWLPTPAEVTAQERSARQQAEAARQQAEAARQRAEDETERLRRELEDARRQLAERK